MTQAPTPGPMTVEITYEVYQDGDFCASSTHLQDAEHYANLYGQDGPVKCQTVVSVRHDDFLLSGDARLAPTAPVEASGSEDMRRREITAVMTALDSFAVLAGRVTATQAEHVLASLAALRPQPSGETREALWWAAKALVDNINEFGTVTDDVFVNNLDALLSARPLALGGQQGDSETLRVLLDNLVIAQTLSKDIRQKATDEARSYLYDRRHTPARAEAQDEGAAGEPVAKVVRKGFSTGSISWTKFGQDADLSDETPLYAHPSPTPAADEDRVRK